MTDPTVPQTYKEWYQVEAIGTPLDNPTLFTTFRVGTAANPNPRGPAQLRTSASNSLDCKLAFLGVDNNNRSFVISRYHELQVSLGLPSALAGRGYSTSKDLRADGGTVTVEPDNAFMNVARGGATIVVPTLASLRQQLTANPPADAEWTTGPHIVGDADTEEVTVRMMVPIPAKYVHLLLEGGDTGLQLFQKLDAAIVADNVKNECTALYAWLRAAVTLATVAANNVVTVRMPAPTLIDRNEALEKDRLAILDDDLPQCSGRHTLSGALAGGLAGLRDTFQGYREEATTRAQDRELQKAENKTVTKRFSIILPHLMRICQGNNSDELPPLWHDLAKQKESLAQAVVEQTLASAREASSLAAPLMFVSPILVENLKRGVFAAPPEEDIYSGVSIFQFCMGTGSTRAAADQVAATMDAVQRSCLGASVSNMEAARSKLKAQPVESALGLQRVLCQFSHATDGIFGSNHFAAMEYCGFCNTVSDENEHLERIIAEDRTNGMRFLFAVYLLWWIWLSEQTKSSTQLSAPVGFLTLWKSIKSRSWAPPALPAEFCSWVEACAQAHLPGDLNVMADILSRHWDLTDDEILTLFTLQFPQKLPWKICRLRSAMNSAMTSALLKQRSSAESLNLALALETAPSKFGASFVNNLEKRRTSSIRGTPSRGSSSTPNGSALVDSPKMVNRSELELWKKKYLPLRRRTPYWDTRILDLTRPAKLTTDSRNC